MSKSGLTGLFCIYNKYMKIDFDSVKDALNQDKHGISLKEAALLEWDTALV